MALVCNYCPYLAVCFRITYFRGQERFKHAEITYNLGQEKIEQKTPAPPPPSHAKSRMKSREGQKPAIFPILIVGGEGGGGCRFSIHFVQNCNLRLYHIRTPPSASRSPSPLRGHGARKTQDIYEHWYCHRTRHGFFVRIPVTKYVFRPLSTKNCMDVSSIKKEVQEETLHFSRSQGGGNLIIHLL